LASLITLVLLASCERAGEGASDRALAAEALKAVLVYPGSAAVSAAAGQDAAQATFTTPHAVQVVAAWYRETLKLNGWRVKGDQLMPDGSLAIYAERGGRPLWITLQRNGGGPGTTYTLVGAIPTPDSSKAQRSGSSMSSNRIQRR
jgi:hypothetical protein